MISKKYVYPSANFCSPQIVKNGAIALFLVSKDSSSLHGQLGLQKAALMSEGASWSYLKRRITIAK